MVRGGVVSPPPLWVDPRVGGSGGGGGGGSVDDNRNEDDDGDGSDDEDGCDEEESHQRYYGKTLRPSSEQLVRVDSVHVDCDSVLVVVASWK